MVTVPENVSSCAELRPTRLFKTSPLLQTHPLTLEGHNISKNRSRKSRVAIFNKPSIYSRLNWEWKNPYLNLTRSFIVAIAKTRTRDALEPEIVWIHVVCSKLNLLSRLIQDIGIRSR